MTVGPTQKGTWDNETERHSYWVQDLDSGIGWADIYETDNENVLCLLDHKKQKTFVKSIDEIVIFNHYIWKSFYNKNKEDYALTVDNIWFKYLNQANLLTYSPL